MALSKPLTHPRSVGPVIAIGAIAMGVGAALGFVPGFIATTLRSELAISKGAVGVLVGLYFGCTGLGSILGGRLTERFGARVVVIADMLAVAVASAAAAAIGTYWSLVIASILGGSAYALVNSGTNVAVAAAVPAHRRTLAMSIKTAGVPAMAAITAAAGPGASNRWSWQHVFWLVAVVAVIAAIAAAVVLEDDRPATSGRAAKEALPPGFIWFPIGAFLLIAGTQPLYSWVVPYLEQDLNASPSVAGSVSAVASTVGIGVMMVNAVRSDRGSAAQRPKRIAVLLGINAVAIAMVMLGDRLGIGVAAIGTVIGIAAQLSAIGTMHAAIVDRAPHAVARATGWTMTGYYLGALVAPIAFGAIADVADTFAWSWIASIVTLLMAMLTWAAAGRVGSSQVATT